MRKLLLVDDEPLALVGLQGMLPWEQYGIEICATARNGAQALKLIEQKRPDIVIADIMMPIQSGLELLQTCREKFGRLPLFIILTSVEKYQFAREALSGQAVEYLVKLELTPEILGAAIAKAVDILSGMGLEDPANRTSPSERLRIQSFYDRFFVRLFNNLFESKDQFLKQQAELSIDFSFGFYVTCYCEIGSLGKSDINADRLIGLYTSTTRMAWETVTRYMACYVTSLEPGYFAITFCLSEHEAADYQNVIESVLQQTILIVKNYFNVNLMCGVGKMVDDPLAISYSFRTSRHALSACDDRSLSFYNDNNSESFELSAFSKYKSDLLMAIEHEDYQKVDSVLDMMLVTLANCPGDHRLVMETACNLLFLVTTNLIDGEYALEQIFSHEADGYKSLYTLQTPNDVLRWIETFKLGIVQKLQTRNKGKNKNVEDIKAYLNGNLDKRITLNQTASTFGFNPNYLSQLFAKHVGCSFIDYLNSQKIKQAKTLLLDSDLKIYEISEQLGFDSAFYFSKVFKKYTGLSPREYARRQPKIRE